jgi:hypothetical protein
LGDRIAFGMGEEGLAALRQRLHQPRLAKQ